jgi:phenylalanine-4-hydroxylase
MERMSDRLEKLSGWRVVPVAELVPDDVFSGRAEGGLFDHSVDK